MVELIIRIIGALVVGVAVYFGDLLPAGIPKAVSSVVVACLFLFLDPILEYSKKHRKSKEKNKVVRSYVDLLNKHTITLCNAKVDFKRVAAEIEREVGEVSKEGVAFIVLENYYTSLDETTKDGIFLTYLCHLIDSARDDVQISVYKKRISELLSKYDFINLDVNARLILCIYHNFTQNQKYNIQIRDMDFADLFDRFSKKYSHVLNLAFRMVLEKEQMEEFRKTLSILILRGKLNIRQLNKDLSKKIGSEFESRSRDAKAYLLLSNKFYKIDAVQNFLDSLPGIKIGTKYSIKLPQEIKYLHMRIIYPPDNYLNPKDFLSEEIVPLIPQSEQGKGFISIIPIEGTEVFSYPESSENIRDEKVKESFSSINSIRTGLSVNLADVFLDNIDSEIPLNNILSIIPFNIFIPHSSQRIKNFIIDNYETLKNKFQVAVLSDWADITIRNLKNEFIRLDIARGTKRLHTAERWEEVARKIISEAIRHRDALHA